MALRYWDTDAGIGSSLKASLVMMPCVLRSNKRTLPVLLYADNRQMHAVVLGDISFEVLATVA
jgi:hypothetical protein